MMVGVVAISRAMPDGDEADQILASALQSATALAASKPLEGAAYAPPSIKQASLRRRPIVERAAA